ncbi:TetR/AcrR family transcriptional regulator [Streptomyces sp. NPDC059631]|uniref:TetR/AcrR family transcriptional regulator n=1 Tax=unclassified Streptomyces TaxID=2593676 RepID=UPI0036867EC4
MTTHISDSGHTWQGVRRMSAADARSAILAAATRLFVHRGYRNVTVGDIAREAGTALPTVYAGAGGKAAILTTLIDEGSHDPIVEWTLDAVRACGDPGEVITLLVHGIRVDNERYEDLVRVMITAAALEDTARQTLDRSDQYYRQSLGVAAARLADLTALRPGLTAERVTDILWFYLGHHSWRLCVSDQGWAWEEAERWLAEQVRAAVLGTAPGRAKGTAAGAGPGTLPCRA